MKMMEVYKKEREWWREQILVTIYDRMVKISEIDKDL